MQECRRAPTRAALAVTRHSRDKRQTDLDGGKAALIQVNPAKVVGPARAIRQCLSPLRHETTRIGALYLGGVRRGVIRETEVAARLRQLVHPGEPRMCPAEVPERVAN
jgi:hypothetical protein